MQDLVLLKLGGSLITDKTQPYTPRLDILANLAAQIKSANVSLILGHGSGSFGHTAAKQFKTRDGIVKSSPSQPSPLEKEIGESKYWQGFAEVWHQASNLNRYVMEAIHNAGIQAITFAPSACVTACNGKITRWDLVPIRNALEAGLMPVIYGDVVFDDEIGGTILSTEELFEHLARSLHPERILLAGLEEAIWADFPIRKQRVSMLTAANFEEFRTNVGAATGTDVTGGMLTKVEKMLHLVQENSNLSVQIFSGEVPGKLKKALRGEHVGTLITS